MANPHPTPRLENLRPPWQPGTSGNPAGYSQGRRISDAIEGLIDELGLQREFGTTAIAMALGKKHLLKQKVTDPETGEDVWVEQKPDLAWFKMIVQRIEPVAQQMDAVTRLRAILDDIDREDPDPVDQGKAAQSPERSQSASAGKPFHVVGPSGVGCLQARRKLSQPARSSRTCQRKQAAATIHSPLATRHSPPSTTCQRTQAAARSRSRPPRRIFPPAISSRPWRWNDRPPSAARRSCAVFSSCSSLPGMLSGSWRSLQREPGRCPGLDCCGPFRASPQATSEP